MNVPKLRFKEFKDEWSTIELSKISSEISYGMGLPSKEYDGINKYIRITDIDENTSKYTNKDIVSPDGELEDKYIVKKNDILFARTGASTGKTYLYDKKDGKLYYAGFLIKANIINHDANFIFQQTHTSKYNKWIKVMSMRSGQPGINSQEYGSYKFSITSKTEEYKISKTLQLLDKKIELQTKKIEDLKLFKKGLINVLNKKSYQETVLGKIGKFQTSSIDKLVKENEKIVNLYNYMDVYKHKILMTQDLKKLSKTSAKDNQITINNLKRGDILFTPSSETPDDIGHSICIQEDLPNTVYSYHLLRYRPNIIMDPLFSNYYFNNSKIRKQIIRYSTGATRYTISLDSFLKIKVDIPDLITQKKYGLLLYSTDKKVNKELFKLNKLQELKKGLIQDMFV